jgi:hypothetical protein
MRRAFLAMLVMGAAVVAGSQSAQAAGEGQPSDWNRFYNYPYVYYPHNFQAPAEYNSLYNRYPQARQIPVYNKSWYNFYPTKKPYYMGHHMTLDVF